MYIYIVCEVLAVHVIITVEHINDFSNLIGNYVDSIRLDLHG